jgi:hypothetical protein
MASTKKKSQPVAPTKQRRDKREKPEEEKLPTLAEQVFGVLAQLFMMWVISTAILYFMRYFNIGQSPTEPIAE